MGPARRVSNPLGRPGVRAMRWSALTGGARFALQLIAQVLLARELGPQAFGLFAIGMVAITLAGFVAGFGLSWSLMQRAKLDDEDIRFAWTWQLLAGLAALLLLQALAPAVAAAFKEPAAEPVIRWLSLSCLLQGKLRGDVAGVHIHLAERLSLVRKGTLMLACRALGLPMIVHLHAAQFPQFYRRLPAPARWLTRWLLRLPAGLIVLGQSSQRFVTEVLQVPAERVSIVLNGVPAPQLPRRIPGAFKRVLFVGNLSERKGVSDLLQALCLPGWDRHQTQVVLAGGGDIEGYRLQAQALGLADWVEFTGWLDQAQVAQQMARADVLVLPSYDEGLPLVILEAMAQGVAVVCTPVGEIGQVIEDGQQALFVTPGDPTTLAHRLQQVLSDETLRSQLEQTGRALYAQRFSMATFKAQIAALHRRYFGLS
jgi:glycosyltransferase involved in cell wall biosynthesis